jgi:hypothetical protein
VAADRVVLELTEHTGVADYPALQAALAELRALGMRVGVDDTGSGFASLSHILKLRPDVVKLDLDLVRGPPHRPGAACAGGGAALLRRADRRLSGRGGRRDELGLTGAVWVLMALSTFILSIRRHPPVTLLALAAAPFVMVVQNYGTEGVLRIFCSRRRLAV